MSTQTDVDTNTEMETSDIMSSCGDRGGGHTSRRISESGVADMEVEVGMDQQRQLVGGEVGPAIGNGQAVRDQSMFEVGFEA